MPPRIAFFPSKTANLLKKHPNKFLVHQYVRVFIVIGTTLKDPIKQMNISFTWSCRNEVDKKIDVTDQTQRKGWIVSGKRQKVSISMTSTS